MLAFSWQHVENETRNSSLKLKLYFLFTQRRLPSSCAWLTLPDQVVDIVYYCCITIDKIEKTDNEHLAVDIRTADSTSISCESALNSDKRIWRFGRFQNSVMVFRKRFKCTASNGRCEQRSVEPRATPCARGERCTKWLKRSDEEVISSNEIEGKTDRERTTLTGAAERTVGGECAYIRH